LSDLPELVLLPGLDGSGALFAGLQRAAPRELSLSVLRYPDEGRQDYPALQAQLAPELAARRGPYVLVAESFGGPLALRIGAGHPPGLTAIVLVNSFVAAPFESRAVGIASRTLSAIGSPLLARLGPPLSALIRRFMVGDDAPDALVQEVQAVLRALPAHTLAARLRTVIAANETQAYLHTQLPIFYLRGTEDRLVGDHAIETLIRLRPGLQLHRLPGPHLLLQRHPEETLALLQACLDERAG
jgi:pimeloyl-[acyl-carrier protein] methyl ester esterase